MRKYGAAVSFSKARFYFETNKLNKDNRYSYYFANPEEVLVLEGVESVYEVELFFERLEELRKDYYLAGFLSYELCNILGKDRLGDIRAKSKFPYALFGVYKGVRVYDNKECYGFVDEVRDNLLEAEELVDKAWYATNNFKLLTSFREYEKRIQRIKELIKGGEVYQINYTTKYRFNFGGSCYKLYNDLKACQKTSYSVYGEFGDYAILSFSPELFFRVKGNRIKMKPIKGTIGRGLGVEEDLKVLESFKRDEKNMSENVMIVDLLRNDLGRVCKFGTVEVKKLFEIERYATLYQMVSTLEGELRDNISFYEILKCLYPSGSITGAPKYASMDYIRELEDESRKVYTGSLGFLSPSGEMVFNVGIRTLLIEGGKWGEYGIGSGIIYDSEARSEYRECKLKAKFVKEVLERGHVS